MRQISPRIRLPHLTTPRLRHRPRDTPPPISRTSSPAPCIVPRFARSSFNSVGTKSRNEFVSPFRTRAIARQVKLTSNDLVQTMLTPADFSTAQVDFVPHSLRDVKLQKSEIAWADIGGASLSFLPIHSCGSRTASDGHHVYGSSCSAQVCAKRSRCCGRRSSGRPSTALFLHNRR